MKPIRLALSGLQSYRDKQEVDFTKLADAGVFGIFGPTGSGKSSILDAMTLALYGRVERAPGGTQGIINQMETVCSVSYTFELSGGPAAGSAREITGAHTQRYRVERQYKRTGEVTVNQSMARLVLELEDGGAAVLADKAKEVDARIQEILGLSMADFTRAVVLPQGKFAEFLSLKGVERRHMLERLFHLEQYGDELSSKVGATVRETDNAVKRTEAEQLGLGDASGRALEEATGRLEEARQAAEAQRKQLHEAEQRSEEERSLWQWSREQAALESDMVRLNGRLPEMEAIRNRLSLAGHALRVEHFLLEWEEAQTALAQAAGQLAEAEAVQAAVSADLQLQQQVYDQAQKALEAEDEPLQERISAIRQALVIHGELASSNRELAEWKAKEDGLTQALKEAQELAAVEQQKYDKAQALQLELKARLAAVQPDSGRRELLQGAMLARKEWEAVQQNAAAAGAELGRARSELAAEQLRQAEAQQRANEQQQARLELAAQGAGWFVRLGELDEAAAELAAAIRAGAEQAKRQEQAQWQASLAAKLAETLVEGEACPVCGATRHPAPASSSGDAANQLQTATDSFWQQLGVAATELQMTAKQLQAGLAGELGQNQTAVEQDSGNPAQGMNGASGRFTPANKEVAAGAASALLPAAGGSGPSEGDRAKTAGEADARVNNVRGELRTLEAHIKAWSQTMRRLAETERQESSGLAAANAKLAVSEAALSALSAKEEQTRQAEEAARRSWQLHYPGLAPEDATRDWTLLQEQLRQQDELLTRLAKAEPYLEACSSQLRLHQEQGSRLERELGIAATERKGREAAVEERRQRLESLLHGNYPAAAVESLLQEAISRQQLLKREEAQGRALLGQLQQAAGERASALAAAKQGRLFASAALDRAAANGQRELAAAGFAEPAAARAALLSPAGLQQLADQQSSYQEELAKTQTRLNQVTASLAGRHMSDEQWALAVAKLTAERDKLEEQLRTKAKAERDLEELTVKHERWRVLEQLREADRTKLIRLQKLQTVLRGNAFVEFMAMEQLLQVSRAASDRLSQLTRRRYALETDSSGGFVIRDDANGGLRRPVSTLSGGETFLTSLALALALSAQIQLNGTHPLEFFFLDEGFGTLDPDLLETVVHALEKLHLERLTVGVISHVPELKSRLPRRLVVVPADASGAGSRISFETL